MKTATTRQELAELLSGADSRSLGFVPTMGALHRGHLSLVEAAKKDSNVVVVSIFVNPTQFNDPVDLETYPRTPAADLQALEKAGVDIVFAPDVKEIYPEKDTRVFDLGGLDEVMEGDTRPGHFNGVAQVVSRLFELVNPDKAYFGEKDFQQLAVIREMVRRGGFEVDIVGSPTVREKDGLAMSSRNALLDAEHREAAPGIYAALREATGLTGSMTPRQVEEYVIRKVDSDPLLQVIYFNIVDAGTLLPAQSWNEKCGVQGCIAVQAGNVRLIDNIRFV